MSKLQLLKKAASLSELALLLEVKPPALSYALYKIPSAQKYKTFTIPKQSGGTREISAPEPHLKKIQKALNKLLNDCRIEIDALHPNRIVVSHGFRKKYSIITNARVHRHKRYVLNVDIENFFPSLNFGRVRGFFIKDKTFSLHEDVATVIAQIACHNNCLPQGSPSSPIISDLMGRLLDVRLVHLAKLYKCTYSRYVDDLTISTDKKTFPLQLAYQIGGLGSPWVIGDAILDAFSDAAFKVNHQKTRVQYRNSRQTVTGLVVNSKVNVRSDVYRNARAKCHSLFATGLFTDEKVEGEVGGKTGTIQQIEGMVSFIHHVKREEVARNNKNALQKTSKPEKTGIHKLYERLLFYKYCAAPDKPVIICEGKTDVLYLKAAIKYLPQFRGVLGQNDGKKFKYGENFFPYSRTASEVMSLNGGTGDLAAFISRYFDRMAGFKHTPRMHPVIIFVDNDKGLEAIKSVVGPHVSISHKDTAPFYRIDLNLYIVKTLETNGLSEIENFLPPELLKTELNGKTLNLKKKHESPDEYGKNAFAKEVVMPKLGAIDFSGFVGLIDRIVAVRNDYYAAIGAP